MRPLCQRLRYLRVFTYRIPMLLTPGVYWGYTAWNGYDTWPRSSESFGIDLICSFVISAYSPYAKDNAIDVYLRIAYLCCAPLLCTRVILRGRFLILEQVSLSFVIDWSKNSIDGTTASGILFYLYYSFNLTNILFLIYIFLCTCHVISLPTLVDW